MTKEEALNLFTYNAGKLYWKYTVSNRALQGDEAGALSHGYTIVMHNYRNYRIHRLIFLMHHGYSPEFLDHIDGNRGNNRIENLRECSRSQNAYNKGPTNASASGIKNVHWDAPTSKWRVVIKAAGKEYKLGRFSCLEEAAKVAKEAQIKYHGSFAKV